MRTALLSDVHGNFVALEAVLADLERRPADIVVCLGDMAQGGPQPAEVVDRLLELGWPVVLGNADAFLLDAGVGEPPTESQLAGREWSRGVLGSSRLEAIGRFAPLVEADLGDGRALLAFHGSPGSYDDFLLPHLPEAVFRELLGDVRADVLAGGHVHLQFVRRVGDALFVNPGSVGLSYDHEQPPDEFRADAWAGYAVVETGDGTLEVSFRRVPFDASAVASAFLASGHPDRDQWAAQWRPAGRS